MIDGSGTRMVRFGPEGRWSIGAVNSTLVITGGGSVATLRACPAQPSPATSLVSAVEVHAAGESVSIAYVCSDGTYNRWSIDDVGAWTRERAKQQAALPPQGGYGVATVTWIGDALVTVKLGEEGRVEANGAPLAGVPHITALSGFTASPGLAAFGVEGGAGTASPVLGVRALEHGTLTLRRAWPLTCDAPSCILRAVAGAGDDEHVAGLLVEVRDDQKTPAVSLVLARGTGAQAIALAHENPLDVAVGEWRGAAVAAVPLAGRIRLYGWIAQTDGSWEATQRRLGLTVRYGQDARVEKVDEAGLQGARHFREIFPE